ncbi:TfuA-like protein [Longimycelium tulufanense]|uniref:TfuA-like protein n=1 Tax=Longimycelium tulufanense TaxID=907463 RepID=UPI00166DF7F9|nr:TfuA-like protein [Longimycelium tulufanense]
MSIHIFTGPTLSRVDVLREIDTAHVHGPVSHGDLLRLNLGTGDLALLIDGLYHHHAPVRHKEILEVMANGATVVGAASMGALRAAELHQYGMIGIGRVFEMYRDGVIDSDDEVAVVHTPLPECRRLSEALVNIRHGVSVCVEDEVLTGPEAEEIFRVAKELPYSTRRWAVVEHVVSGRHPTLRRAVQAARAFLADHPEHANLKLRDAALAIQRVRSGTLSSSRPSSEDWRRSADWRTVYLRDWIGEFTGVEVAGAHVGHAAVLRYQQIYDRDFPQRWERYVLERIARSAEDTSGTHNHTRDRALAVARSKNVVVHRMSAEQRSEWLTPNEEEKYSEDEAMIRVLVRASRFSLDFSRPEVVDGALLRRTQDTRSRIAEVSALNHELASRNPAMHIDNLRFDKLREHLAEVWGLDPHDGDRDLTAAARDRGLSSLTEAVAAARPFFLLSHTRTRARYHSGTVSAEREIHA